MSSSTPASEIPIILTQEIDTLQGGAGADTFALQNNSDQLQILLVNPTATEVGTPQNNDLFGTIDNDGIYGRRGNDTISGLKGDDFVDGESGDDLMFGGQGDDLLVGDQGSDTLFGDRGFDIVYGNADADVLFGNLDSDTLYGDSGRDTLYGGQGNDSLVGGSGRDFILGDQGQDTLTGISRSSLGYTHIADFDTSEDTILLPGNIGLYELMPTNDIEETGVELPAGGGIIAIDEEDGTKQLIAVVEGVTNFDLRQSYVEFI